MRGARGVPSRLSGGDPEHNVPVMIRPATREDLPVLQALSVDTFCETFGHLYDPDDLRAYLGEAYSEAAFTALLDDPAHRFLLGEEEIDGATTVVGYVLAGPCDLEHEQVRPGDGEVKRLYLRRTHQGGGRGSALMTAAMQWLLAQGPRVLWLGVWENNFGAQRFYQRFGFEEVGDHVFLIGGHEDRDLVYRRPASSASPDVLSEPAAPDALSEPAAPGSSAAPASPGSSVASAP